MDDKDILTVKAMHSAAIIAPAGHGKTEMIVDLVNSMAGKHLLLTHTNAGVDAIRKRLKKREISKDKYSVNTIAGFCMKWCDAYPNASEINYTIPMSDKRFYTMYYAGAKKLFSHKWARVIMGMTYAAIIVDEYQDCVIEQHSIFLELKKYLRVYVLGDPLQAIFGWSGTLVSWSNITFPILRFKTIPWRWKNTNIELGNYLSMIRDELTTVLDGNSIAFRTENVGDSISVIPCSRRMEPKFLEALKCYKTVLYITKWPNEQQSICQNTGGLFQNDEPQTLEDLYKFARNIDSNEGLIMGKAIYQLMQLCSTHINDELGAYKKHLDNNNRDFHLIRKHKEFGDRLNAVINHRHKKDVISTLNYFKNQSEFRIYRKELFYESIRALNYSIAHGISVEESARQIRMDPVQIKKYSDFQFLSSRTVLSKGLEFECVIIDLSQYQGKQYNVTDFYVAMTRATNKIFIVTDSDTIKLVQR